MRKAPGSRVRCMLWHALEAAEREAHDSSGGGRADSSLLSIASRRMGQKQPQTTCGSVATHWPGLLKEVLYAQNSCRMSGARRFFCIPLSRVRLRGGSNALQVPMLYLPRSVPCPRTGVLDRQSCQAGILQWVEQSRSSTAGGLVIGSLLPRSRQKLSRADSHQHATFFETRANAIPLWSPLAQF